MKYLKILCTTQELVNLFPTANVKEVNYVNKFYNLKITNNKCLIDIDHYSDSIYYELSQLTNIKDVFSLTSLYVNPIKDITILADRKLWTELYLRLMKESPSEFQILEELYIKNNVTVLFNFAFLEAMMYEDEIEYFKYNFKFKNIKLTDYELFENLEGFYYDSFYSLFHILAEGQLSPLIFKNVSTTPADYNAHFANMFDSFNIKHDVNKSKIYSNLALKPRYHRLQFLIKSYEKNVLSKGINSINEKFILEYSDAVKYGNIYTDHTTSHTDNHKKYFTKENFDKLNLLRNQINVTPLNAPFEYDHLLYYFRDREYNASYIEVVGETHCIFNLKYGFFTEKSLKPILANKFVLIFGSNKVYKEFEKIGIDLFLDKFGLGGIETKNELEQIDMIIDFLEKTNLEDIRSIFIENYHILESNRKKMIEHYCKIMNNVNVLLLEDKL
jgi:hypothetical protein